MKRNIMKKLFAVLTLSVCSLGAMAGGPEAGKVYRVINNESTHALCDRGPSTVVGASTVSETNMSQCWLVGEGETNGTFTFRSLGTGLYLTSSDALSQGWTLSTTASSARSQMKIGEVSGVYYVYASNQSSAMSMHEDGSNNIVCWTNDNTNSRWGFTEVPMTQAEIEEALSASGSMLAELDKESDYQAKLSAIFADKACTTLNAAYASKSVDQIKADVNYQALPEVLKAMVIKVATGNWAEGDWNSEYAKRFRIQDYEPFSEGSNGAWLAGIQSHTNMNNPTGILGYTGNNLYVMVENVPKDANATLYIDGVVGNAMNNNTTNGTQLHEGLNIIPQWTDCSAKYIYYVVNTVDYDENHNFGPNAKVTDYEPIKIHIEGGEVNGYFDYAAGDTKEDFHYMAARAKHDMFDLLGEYVIIHFNLFDTESGPGMATLLSDEHTAATYPEDLNIDYVRETMRHWDELCFRERTVMGIQSNEELARKSDLVLNYYEPILGDDVAVTEGRTTYVTDPGFEYSDYFNNRHMALSLAGSLYMYATSWHTAYNINTMESILVNIRHDVGSTWGPAHEYGHNNQGPMKFAGTTEMSNNVFSNVVAYYYGKFNPELAHTSRNDFPSSQLNVFNQDQTFLANSTWGCTRMFFQLWLYYHALGNNKKFYPRLYELLRKYPISHPYNLNPRNDMLHFAKMCCVAAQEDLTDFFESWGFFVPQNDYKISDYSNFVSNLSQEDIDAVKAEIAAFQFPENKQLIFVDDRPGADYESWWGWDKENCGVLGGLKDFEAKVKASGDMTFAIDGSSLKVTLGENASAGVGFLVYGNDGTLLGFSNDYTFPLKKTAMAALMSEKAKVYAIGAEGAMVEVPMAETTVEDLVKNLNTLVTGVQDVVNRIDEEELRAGFYRPFYAKAFVAAYEAAKAVDAATTNKEEVTQLYLNLLNEYNALQAHEFATVRFVPNSKYQFLNAMFPKRVLSSGSTGGKVRNSNYKSDPADSQVWQLVDAGNGKFYIKNVAYSFYMGKFDSENAGSIALVESKSDAGAFSISEISTGYWALDEADQWKSPNISGGTASGTICWWSPDDLNSQWILRLIEPNEKQFALTNLEQLIAEAKALLAQAGVIAVNGTPVTLTEDMFFTNAKCKSSAFGDEFTSWSVLIDGDIQTYFHSDYSSQAPSAYHYLGVDLGEGKSLNSVQFLWTNRDVTGSNASVTNPATVRFEASVDGDDYTTIETISGLPSTSAASYSSPVISDGNDYRYWRMRVTAGDGKANGYPYFAISEFGLNDAVEDVRVDAKYPNVVPDMMTAVRDEIADSEAVLAATTQPTNKLKTAYNELLAVYEALADAMGVETSIEEIIFDGGEVRPAAEGIYDLQGRKLSKVGNGGIYIVNGKKVLVK